MMNNTFEDLSKYLETLPVAYNLTNDYRAKSKVIKDKETCYLLVYLDKKPKTIHCIYLGYFIEDNLNPREESFLLKYPEESYPDILYFKEGSIFMPHNPDGPAYLSRVSTMYMIHGQSYNKDEFKTHLEIITHKNKLNLKKKLSKL